MAKAAKTPAEQTPSAAPLAAEEINHLIETARSETYRAAEDAPKEAGVFKPKSLMELAREARLKEPPPEVAVVVEEPPEAPPEQEFAPVIAGAEEPEPELAEIIEPQPDPTPAPAPVAAAPAIDTEMLERVRTEAYEAGMAEARRIDGAGVHEAVAALEAAAQALRTPPEAALAGLRGAVETAVKQLASARAGLAIDDLPEPFVARIEDLADRLHACTANPVLRLHPDDLEAIYDYVSQSEILASMRIVAGVGLMRGDVELTLGGLAMTDCLEPPEGRRRRMMFRHGGTATAPESAPDAKP